MLTLQYKQSYFGEENYKIESLSQKEKRLASHVETGININNFSKFSFTYNSFTMDVTVWFKFQIGTESLQTIEQFSFKSGEILSRSKPVVKIVDNNVVVIYQVQVKFTTPLNHKHFPVSDHKLTIVLQNKSVSPSELYYSSDFYNFETEPNINSGNWIPTTKYAQSGYVKTEFKQQEGSITADFPSVVYTLDFKNEDLRHFIILYLPLFLIFLLIFTSLLTKIEELSIRFPVVAGVIPILALHSLVIESSSPIGSHITKVDQVYFTLISLALVILLFQSYVALSMRRIIDVESPETKRKKQKVKLYNDIVILLVLTTLIAVLTYSTFS